MMRKLLVNLDDELDLWLKGQSNQSETIRKALYIYKGDISTDTIHGLRQSYSLLLQKLEERFDNYDESFARVDKLIGYLETRM